MEEIDLNIEEINWLKGQLLDYEIIIHAPFINLSLVSSHKQINCASVDILKSTIDIAQKLDAKLITVHGGAYPLFFEQQTVEEKFVENFGQVMEYAKGKMPITVENLSAKKGVQISYPISPSKLTKIKSLIPDINFTLDIGHCVQNDDEFINFLISNKNSIKNIHLHNAIKNGKAHYGFHKKGDLDLRKFLNLLKEIKYSGFLSLEVLGKEDINKSWNLLLRNL